MSTWDQVLERMHVRATVYTDASFKDGHAGVAYWAASPFGRIIESVGGLEVKDPLAAEMEGAMHAITAVVKAWPHVDTLRVVCDNLTVIRYLSRDLYPPKRRHDLTGLVDWTLNRAGFITLEPRWVKSHQNPTENSRFYLNGRVDEMAYAAREKGIGT